MVDVSGIEFKKSPLFTRRWKIKGFSRLSYHRGLGHSLVYSQETETYHMESRFSQEAPGGQNGGVKPGGCSAQE